jgi:hypothetical protein
MYLALAPVQWSVDHVDHVDVDRSALAAVGQRGRHLQGECTASASRVHGAPVTSSIQCSV